jgi:hypothetical protein
MKSMGGRGSEPVPFCVMNQANFEAVLRHILLVRHLRVNIPQRCAELLVRIRTIFARWIRIRIRVKSRIRIKVKILNFYIKAQNRGMEGRGRSQWRPGGLKWSHGVFRICVKVKTEN